MPTNPPGASDPRPVRSASFRLTALTLALVSLMAATGFWMARYLRPVEEEAQAPPANPVGEALPAHLFAQWPKPDLALVLSAQQHGYLLPCGCSRPQFGGLERRYNLMDRLKSRGWTVAAVDLGDIPQLKGPVNLPNVQGLIKYRYSMDALKKMNYGAVGLGKYEIGLSLDRVLGEYALNNPTPPVLAANLIDKDTIYPGEVGSSTLVKTPGCDITLGVTAVVGASVAGPVRDPNVRFEAVAQALPAVLKDLQARKPSLYVLLLQGSFAEAREVAEKFPQFQVILCLTEEEEPSGKPEVVGKTMIVGVGHKGRYVGVVGVNRKENEPGTYQLRYQLVALNEDFLTTEAEEKNHPVVAMIEKYTQELRDADYMKKYRPMQHPLQVGEAAENMPTFVGSSKCKNCHSYANEVWEGTPHAHAYQTLVDAKRPSLRQFDAECIVCHTVGFGYVSGFTDPENTPKLMDVGCESCHGPGSRHAKMPNDERWQLAMNPWKAKPDEDAATKTRRMARIDQFCQKCHDIDNDVKWDFAKKWPKVAHPTPQ